MLLKQTVKAIVTMLLVMIPIAVAHAAPQIEIDSYRYNAGTLIQGATIAHDFIVKNTGDEPLTITPKPC